jgi:hypothetical protein
MTFTLRHRDRPPQGVRPRRRRYARALATAAAAASLAGIGVWVLGPSPGERQLAPARAVAVPVDPSSVAATATSTQTRSGSVTYTAANTLDGDPATAWNSNGARDGNGPGISLTYTFARPVDLRRITVRNGYQKTRGQEGRRKVDLYPLNGRMRTVRVVTDAGRWTWTLADRRAPQTFAAPGLTKAVHLKIITIYPSTRYKDVALSEISFSEAGAT